MFYKTGTCACGEVKYGIRQAPINSAFCYCTACQRHSGSDHWHGLWVKKEDFKLIEGSPSTFERKGDSGKNLTHYFCKTCGVTVAIFVEIGSFYSVAANTISDENIPAPQMLIYTKDALPNTCFPKGIPKYDIVPPEML